MIDMKLITPLILFVLAVALVALLPPGMAAGAGSVHGYISGRVTTTHNVSLTDVSVILVNASNTSEDIAGFKVTCDQNGFFQFLDVPAGNYKAFAWGPYLSAGMSNNITIEDNVTYSCAVVLVPEPYYGNIAASQTSIPLEGGTTQLTITVYDYWENPVGPGKMITTHTTAGLLDPPYGMTDERSQFKTTLTAPDNGSYAEIQEFARGWNGTYYPLQKRIEAAAPTPTPTPTAQPSVTPTPVPSATPLPTPTVTEPGTPTPATSPTAKPTPGFELALGLIALSLVGLSKLRK
jgi:hypothetical protein